MKFLRLSGRTTNWTCGPLLSAMVGAYVAVGLTLGMGFVLYMSLLMSPGFLHHILKDFVECEDFPGYVSALNSSAESVEQFGESGSFGTAVAIPVEVSQVENYTEQETKKFRVLLGILTTSATVDRRHLLRVAYGVQSSDDAEFTVRFVLGALKDDDTKAWIGMENETFGDIIALGCNENMNGGKTFRYFSSLPDLVSEYDYVMKTDDDSYVHLANLGMHLKPLPRTDLYYGYNLPCNSENAYARFMAGAGYLVSWDLVLWIRDSPIPRNKTMGREDELVGQWFNEGGVAMNRATNKGMFYDDPEFGGFCAHDLTPDTILIHKLKSADRFHQVLRFFEKLRNSIPS